MGDAHSVDCAVMKSREALSFEYTADQWAKLVRLLEKQYEKYQWTTNDILNGLLLGNSTLCYQTKLNRLIEEKRVSKERPAYTIYSPTMRDDDHYLTYLLVCQPMDIIRCVLECAASDFYFERYDNPNQKANRKVNQAEAKKVIQCCDFIMSALLNDRGYGSIGRSRISLSNAGLSKTGDEIQKLRKVAESVLRVSSHLELHEKNRRRLRTEYLNRLCHFWVALGGTPTTSFNHRKGKAGEGAGDFVGFILLTAGPVLKGLTANGARRAIENWRKRYLSEPGVIGRGPPYPSGAVMDQGPPEVFAGGQRINLNPSEGWYYLLPPPLPGYARLKKYGRRKQS
jgi:hypothetical protein